MISQKLELDDGVAQKVVWHAHGEEKTVKQYAKAWKALSFKGGIRVE
jgi:hypothetical protein